MAVRDRPKDGAVKSTMTAVFQLRAPSAWKRAALLDALKRTHFATGAAIDELLADLPRYAGLPKTVTKARRSAGEIRRADVMQRIVYATLKAWSLSGASAAAARVDAIGMVESYVASLSDGRASASVPTVGSLDAADLDREHADALLDLSETHGTPDSEGLARDAISRLAKGARLRPLSLHGYGHFFRLLRHPQTDRLFAWINLVPGSSRFAPSQKDANTRAAAFDGEMVDIDTGELVTCKRPTWVLFPLAFGMDYHERRFVLSGKPGGGRLVYRPEADRFELHVGFEFEAPAIEARTFMGLDRGIENIAGWAVVDADGDQKAAGEISGAGLRHVQRIIERRQKDAQKRGKRWTGSAKRHASDEAVHVTANAIVAEARKHGARVVMEDLSNIQRRTAPVPVGNKGGRGGRNLRRILGRQQYGKLQQVLAYKLPRAGLPAPLMVGAWATSITCPCCGHRAKANRPDRDTFRCERCGHGAPADQNAGRIIGTKGAWLAQVPTKAQRGGRALTEEESFDSYLKRIIEKRGGAAEEPARTFVAPDLDTARMPILRDGVGGTGSSLRGRKDSPREGMGSSESGNRLHDTGEPCCDAARGRDGTLPVSAVT